MKPELILSLQFASNMHGSLSPEIKRRIATFMANPTAQTWSDISGIIIEKGGTMPTLWSAMCDMDKTFPSIITASVDGEHDFWPRIPTPDELEKAINLVVFKSHLQFNN